MVSEISKWIQVENYLLFTFLYYTFNNKGNFDCNFFSKKYAGEFNLCYTKYTKLFSFEFVSELVRERGL